MSGMNEDVVGIWSDTISINMDIERSVVIPSETFSSRIPEAALVVKNPTIAIRVIMLVGMIRLIR